MTTIRLSAYLFVAMLSVAACSSEPGTDRGPASSSPPTVSSSGSWVDFDGVEVVPSADCEAAAVLAAREKDSRAAEPLIAATLDACTTADEWLSAVKLHPGVMGLTPSAEIGRLELLSACFGYQQAAVCRDAASRGVTY
ncbi:MAG: hypothetical protein P1U38_01975 [Aeromicrobium sp.]|uniref:hypothetical protein n=1 Tax=Aeromicrobium sp. TaxID=1871063 RepID=UPI0025B84ECF|nr:hypothetical protein [Aeromicrobium sp.]MCK5890501.1 hypothetical protein [Aeromicrobium sp.]MDF1703525.1 hypothetical protein [Aeromicrobium sp.]